MSELVRTTLAIERELLEKFDAWMQDHGYDNRSEAMRDLIRSCLVQEEWSNAKARVVGVVGIVFDHEQHELAQELTHLQHENPHIVLCSQHVHLDQQRCMETIMLRGKADELRRLADAVISQRGVKFGRLMLMSETI